MRIWTLNELFCLTRAEPFALYDEITIELAQDDDRVGRAAALAALRNICKRLEWLKLVQPGAFNNVRFRSWKNSYWACRFTSGGVRREV